MAWRSGFTYPGFEGRFILSSPTAAWLQKYVTDCSKKRTVCISVGSNHAFCAEHVSRYRNRGDDSCVLFLDYI